MAFNGGISGEIDLNVTELPRMCQSRKFTLCDSTARPPQSWLCAEDSCHDRVIDVLTPFLELLYGDSVSSASDLRMRLVSISGLLCLCLLASTAVLGLAGRILAVITPGCKSHLLGQRKLIVELAGRGHDVMVSALHSLGPLQKCDVDYSSMRSSDMTL